MNNRSATTILPWLTATFDAVSGNVAINLPNNKTAVKGVYDLRVRFSKPGVFTFVLGLNLTVFDICDRSSFDAAPILSNDNKIYIIGQGDLNVQATYTDSVSRTTANSCGPYSISVTIDSDASIITGAPINSALTYNTVINSTYFKFFSNQPGLSGVIKYNV